MVTVTRRRLFTAAVLGVVALVFGRDIVHAATCTGANPCNACRNCHSCKRCAKEGGTCGTCRKMRAAEVRP